MALGTAAKPGQHKNGAKLSQSAFLHTGPSSMIPVRTSFLSSPIDVWEGPLLFNVEFAHASLNRCGGPALAPVSRGDAPLRSPPALERGKIAENSDRFPPLLARQLRRGVRCAPDPRTTNQVYVDVLRDFQGVGSVLFWMPCCFTWRSGAFFRA